MNKIGKRILAAAVASSVLVTPVFADPSVDDLKKSKESAQNEVSSLQTQLNTVGGKTVRSGRCRGRRTETVCRYEGSY